MVTQFGYRINSRGGGTVGVVFVSLPPGVRESAGGGASGRRNSMIAILISIIFGGNKWG